MLTAVENPPVLGRPGQSCPPGETRRAGTQGIDSDRQTSPTLGASGVDNATTVLGSHAGTKSVGPLTLQVTGLIGSFHGSLRPVPGSAACCWQTRKGAKVTVYRGEMSIPPPGEVRCPAPQLSRGAPGTRLPPCPGWIRSKGKTFGTVGSCGRDTGDRLTAIGYRLSRCINYSGPSLADSNRSMKISLQTAGAWQKYHSIFTSAICTQLPCVCM